jgi:hypothetical protein
MEEMRAAIEDLEALKELSDEIEETHVETEKALQEEIGAVYLPPNWVSSPPILVYISRQMRRTCGSLRTSEGSRLFRIRSLTMRTRFLSSEILSQPFRGMSLTSSSWDMCF